MAMSALAKLEDTDAIPTLVEALKDTELSEFAVIALRSFSGAATPFLVPLLLNERLEPGQKRSVAELLAAAGWTATAPQEKIWFQVAKGKYWDAAAQGEAAVPPLFAALLSHYPDPSDIIHAILRADDQAGAPTRGYLYAGSPATRKRLVDLQGELYLANAGSVRQIDEISHAIVDVDKSPAALERVAAELLGSAARSPSSDAASFMRGRARSLQRDARREKPQHVTPEDLGQNLARWESSGLPLHWIDAHNGHWGDAEFKGLFENLVTSEYWPVDSTAARNLLDRLTSHWRKDPLNEAIYWLSEWNFSSRQTNKAKIEHSLELVKTYPGGAGLARLLRVLQETPSSKWHWEPIASAVAQCDRKDVLLSRLNVIDKKYGIGERHSYWKEVIKTAEAFVEAKCYSEAISLAMKYLKEYSTDELTGTVLRDALPGAVHSLDSSDLTLLVNLRDIQSSSEDINGNTQYYSLDLSSVRSIARDELRRREVSHPSAGKAIQ
jgi:hypothetical protein